MTVSGISAGNPALCPGDGCPKLNGAWTLSFVSCDNGQGRWEGPVVADDACGDTAQFRWTLTCDGTEWRLYYQTIGGPAPRCEWVKPQAGWDCLGSNTLDLDDVTCQAKTCSDNPASITLTPV